MKYLRATKMSFATKLSQDNVSRGQKVRPVFKAPWGIHKEEILKDLGGLRFQHWVIHGAKAAASLPVSVQPR